MPGIPTTQLRETKVPSYLLDIRSPALLGVGVSQLSAIHGNCPAMQVLGTNTIIKYSICYQVYAIWTCGYNIK